MILAVDVGNSNTTVGLFNGTGELLFRALLETSRSKTWISAPSSSWASFSSMGRMRAR